MHKGWSGLAWYAGITSPGAQIVYLVEPDRASWLPVIDSDQQRAANALARSALADRLKVGIITEEEAIALCKMQWEKELEWEGD